jgi:hypothetical protein
VGVLAGGDDILIAYKSAVIPTAAHTHTAGAITMGGSTAAGSSHTHAVVADVGDEVTAGTNLAAITDLRFVAVGYLA